ncbi:hypothetical protein QR64_10120 [Rhodococcus sp. Chr-9]|nr:hypothetical protein QR64_10120 [Rhodococcus sp. Chr-9]
MVGCDETIAAQRQHPHARLPVPRRRQRETVALGPPLQQRRDHLALTADHGSAGTGRDLQRPLAAAVRIGAVLLLRQGRLDRDLESVPGGEGFDRRDAPRAVGGHHAVAAECRQLRNESLGLRPSGRIEGPVTVVALVLLPTTRLGVPHDQRHGRVQRHPAEPAQDTAVHRIGQQIECLFGGHPTQFVNLVIGRELPVEAPRSPVVHPLELAVTRNGVDDLPETTAERGAESGLLLDLPHRGNHGRLTRVELALRKGPVVVARAMHERDLHIVRSVLVDRTPQDRARREDVGLHGLVA